MPAKTAGLSMPWQTERAARRQQRRQFLAESTIGRLTIPFITVRRGGSVQQRLSAAGMSQRSYIAGGAADKRYSLCLMKLLEPSQYQAVASAVFASVVRELVQLLPGARFEHVGASAIPGAISKGDLDICIVVASVTHQSTVETLEAFGYVVKTNTLRTPDLCMLLSPRQDLDVALQVVAEGSQFEFFMRFRDALRADPSLVEQYNQLKRDFASMAPERYRYEKAKFIESVLGAV